MEWLNKILQDEDIFKDIVSALKFVLPIIALLFFWGFLDGIKLANIKLSSLSVVALIFIWGLDGIRIDWRTRSFTDTIKLEVIALLYLAIEKIKFTREDKKLGQEFAKIKTQETQDFANAQKTEKVINRLEKKEERLGRLGKNTSKIQQRIEYLKTNPLSARRITPFNYYKIKSPSVNGKTKSYVDGSVLEDNPVQVGRFRAIMFGLIKNTVIAGSIGGVVWNQGAAVVLTIIGIYIVSALWTMVMQYYLTKKYTLTKHKEHLENLLEIKEECREYIDKNKALEQSKPQNDIQVEKKDNVRVDGNNGVSEAFGVKLPIKVVK